MSEGLSAVVLGVWPVRIALDICCGRGPALAGRGGGLSLRWESVSLFPAADMLAQWTNAWPTPGTPGALPTLGVWLSSPFPSASGEVETPSSFLFQN